MKKLISAVITAAIALSMVACGETAVKTNKYWGTWNAVSVEAEGVTFTVEEMKALGEDAMEDFHFVIKEGGKAYVYVEGYGDMLDWTETDTGIIIGEANCRFEEGCLYLVEDDYSICFEKVSDSQTIVTPEEESKDEEIIDEEPVDYDYEDDFELTEGIRPEFKEAMDSYEAFFDEYIEFMNKYSEADTSEMITLLADYTEYMTEFAEAMEEFEELDYQDMSTEEAIYYMEVYSRITAKLMEIGV